MMLLLRAVVAMACLFLVTLVKSDLGCCLVKVLSSRRVSFVTVLMEVVVVVTRLSMLDSSSTNKLSRSDISHRCTEGQKGSATCHKGRGYHCSLSKLLMDYIHNISSF